MIDNYKLGLALRKIEGMKVVGSLAKEQMN